MKHFHGEGEPDNTQQAARVGRVELAPKPGPPASAEYVSLLRELADIKRILKEIRERLPR